MIIVIKHSMPNGYLYEYVERPRLGTEKYFREHYMQTSWQIGETFYKYMMISDRYWEYYKRVGKATYSEEVLECLK